MARALVIVESPAKAKTINKFLGSDYTVKASMGHLRDPPKTKLGVDEDKGFKPTYVVVPDKKKKAIVTDLKKAAAKASGWTSASSPTPPARRSCETSPSGRPPGAGSWSARPRPTTSS